MANDKSKDYGPMANDGSFDVDDVGDVHSAHIGVNSPRETPRGDMPHRRGDVTSATKESQNNPILDPGYLAQRALLREAAQARQPASKIVNQ